MSSIMKEERWLPIEDYEGLYEVSSEGRVRSYYFGKVSILKPEMTRYGYLQVVLCKDRKNKHFKVHRLVATAFIPNIFGDDCVNHINEVKTDNRADNLMWCNWKENDNWGTRIQRITEKTTNGKCSKPVLQFSLSGEFIREWPSSMEIERVLGFYRSNISNCCLGRIKSYKGFVWKFS